MSADFLGFGGLAISTIGTVAVTKEVGKTLRSFSSPPKRKMKKKTPMRKSGVKAPKIKRSLGNIKGFY